MNDSSEIDDQHDNSSNAVSIFGQSASAGDFPVLKAFQEYIDAEQSKARKRMVWLSVFFVSLLGIVVITFALIMAAVINRDQKNLADIANRNQALSDRLLDIALRDRTSPAPVAPVVNVQQPSQPMPAVQSQENLKPVLEKLSSMVQELSAPKPASVPQPANASAASAENAEILKLRAELKELKRQQEKAEREKIKAENDKRHQEEVEQHRRKLYPEFYAKQDAEQAAKKDPAKAEAAKQAELAKQKAELEKKSQLEEERAKLAAEEAAKKAEAEKKKTEVEQQRKAEEAAKKQKAEAERKRLETEAAMKKAELDKAKQEIDKAVAQQTSPSAKPNDKANANGNGGLNKIKPINYFDEAEEDLKELAEMSNKNSEKSSAVSVPPLPAAKDAKTPDKPAAKSKEDSKVKTETINIGTNGNSSIPWLIELPEKK